MGTHFERSAAGPRITPGIRSPRVTEPAEPGLRQEWRALSAAGRVEVASLAVAVVLLLWAVALLAVYAPLGR